MEWMEFYEAEPWGEKIADLRGGQLCSLIANCNRDPKTRPEPFRPIDFMLSAEAEPERELTDEELEQQLTMIFGA